MALRMLRPFRRDGEHDRWRRRLLPRVYRYAFAVLPGEEDAREVTRATFERAGRHGPCRDRLASRRRLVDVAHALARERATAAGRLHGGPLGGGACDEIERLLSCALDGRARRGDRRRLRAHLDGCRDCRARAASHGAVRRALRSLAAVPVPSDLLDDGTRFTSSERRGSLAPEDQDQGRRRVGIVNRRNAMLGWAAWQVGKRVARRKAKSAVPAIDAESKRPNKPAVAAAVAALVGGLVFWRRRRDGGSADEDEAE